MTFTCPSHLQDIDISGDPANTDSLFVVVHNRNSTQKRPKLSGKFVFDDHIRCCAAKSVFQRAREHLHHSKMLRITKMLELPPPESPSAVSVVSTQQKQFLDATPPSLVSSTATVTMTGHPLTTRSTFSLTSSQLTSSALHEVFRGASPIATSEKPQEFELSALSTPSRIRISILQDDIPVNDSPVRLTLPAPLPPHVNPSSAASPEGMGHGSDGMGRDTSLTPEPQAYLDTSDTEEMLTASGGLFQYSNLSSSLGFEDSMKLGFDGDRVMVSRVRPGMGLESHAVPMMDRLDTTGESVVATSSRHAQGDASTEHAQEDVDDLTVQVADGPGRPTHKIVGDLQSWEERSTGHAQESDLSVLSTVQHAQENADLTEAQEDVTESKSAGQQNAGLSIEHTPENLTEELSTDENVHPLENVNELQPSQEISPEHAQENVNEGQSTCTQEIVPSTEENVNDLTKGQPTPDNVVSPEHAQENVTEGHSTQDSVVSPEHAEEDENHTREHDEEGEGLGEGAEVEYATAMGSVSMMSQQCGAERASLNSANTGADNKADSSETETQPNQEHFNDPTTPEHAHIRSISSGKLVNGVSAAKSDLSMVDSEPSIEHISHTEQDQSPAATEHAQWSAGSETELNTDSESDVPHPPPGDAWLEGSKPLVVLASKSTGVPVTFDTGPGHVTAETGERTPPYHAHSSDSVTNLISQ